MSAGIAHGGGGRGHEDREGLRPHGGPGGGLAAVFGVPPSNLVDRGKRQPVLDDEVMDALADETAAAILRESARLPEREKRIDLGIVREFAGGRTTSGGSVGSGLSSCLDHSGAR